MPGVPIYAEIIFAFGAVVPFAVVLVRAVTVS